MRGSCPYAQRWKLGIRGKSACSHFSLLSSSEVGCSSVESTHIKGVERVPKEFKFLKIRYK